ncbi:MAG: glutathione S-transferase family protein, partial [Gammaproteobacteria bacterium]|nr:glutathione S-transferase family protein [Gammaproteobacteria bacterium]
MKPELISFDLCPFVQRSVITLLEKDVDFDITYIDLANPPQWFLDISPFGKVPALRVGDETLFESAVINEYLDDITPPSMHPTDPLQKAINKAWIEFASQMLGAQYHYCFAPTEDVFNQSLNEMKDLTSRLEGRLGDGPYFNGKGFCLIDAAFAPFFTRANLLESYCNNDLYTDALKVTAWAKKLVSKDSVINSVKPDFAEKFMTSILNAETFASQVFA